VAAYRAHDRVVAADSKPASTLALLQDWWAAWQQADHDPAREVIVLAARRADVDRLNTACQELLAARAASEWSGCRSRTASWRSGTGSCMATMPLLSWGWPTAAAGSSPPSTLGPGP
jgi:hypothetical protein